MASNTIDHVAQKGFGQKTVEAMATKFSKNFAISTLQTVNRVTEGNHQVTTRAVTWWLPRKVGEMV